MSFIIYAHCHNFAENISIMAIQNEIIKVVAQVELDDQGRAEAAAGLKKLNDQCADLRKEIEKTETEMTKLAAAGKKDSQEFQDLGKHLKQTKEQLQASTKLANQHARALGLNQMTYNQLKANASKLRKELNSLHKESNPEAWENYNEELIATEKRMKEVQGGLKESENGLARLQSILGKHKKLFTALGVTAKVLSNIFMQITEQTQTWGDKWQVTVAKTQAGWNQFIANLGQGNNVIKASIREAMEAAGKAQELLDDLFERNNSLRIQEAQARKDMAIQQSIVNDATKSQEERLAAMEEILRIERDLAATKLDIANQENEAALLKLSKARVKLSEDELKTVINAYNQNYDAFTLAKEYNELLNKRAQFEKDLSSSDATTRKIAATHYDDLTEKMNSYSETTIEYARILRQYNLSNDELVKAYVDAQVHIIEASTEVAEKEASQAEKRSSLTKQMESADQQAREEAYNKRIKAAEDAYANELTALKTAYAKREITEAEYQTKSHAAEVAMLLAKKAINTAYGKDIVAIDQQIADKRLESTIAVNAFMEKQRKDFDKIKKDSIDALNEVAEAVDDFAAELDDDAISNPVLDAFKYKQSSSSVGKDAKLAELQSSFDAEMMMVEELHKYKMISEEEFLARKKKLTEDYAAQEREIQTKGWTEALNTAMMVIDGVSSAVSAAKDAEMASIDAQMAKELAAAGDNADKRAEIESRYEAKKLDLQKKYADTEMGIQLAQATASGAMAMIQAWNAAGGNPVLAGVIMALIGATTVAQLATIVAQRNAIKNSTLGSSSSGASVSQQRTVNGFSEGGYTGDGGRLEVAGVVHRGEYVVPQPELRDPAVAAMVANIETRRRRRTSANALPGFAEGGYTGMASGLGKQTDALLEQILKEIRTGNETPTPAYFVLSDLYAKQELEAKMKKQTSLG